MFNVRPAAITALPALSALGRRIVILGPSGAGKSTLAAAIARKCGMRLVHLDPLYHQPDTDWQARTPGEFDRLHDAAIAAPDWVMDGNYTRHLQARLARASGVILLDLPVPLCLARYLRRCLSPAQRPHGGLPGGSERIKWHMLRFIALEQPAAIGRIRSLIRQGDRPVVHLTNTREIAQAYAAWQLAP